MRETEKSLRAYFIVAALLSGAINIAGLLRSSPGFGTVIFLVGVGLSIAYFYLGVRLRHLLVESFGTITAVLISGVVFQVLLAGFVLLSGPQTGVIVQTIVALLITWYLFANSKRLAAQAKQEPTSGN